MLGRLAPKSVGKSRPARAQAPFAAPFRKYTKHGQTHPATDSPKETPHAHEEIERRRDEEVREEARREEESRGEEGRRQEGNRGDTPARRGRKARTGQTPERAADLRQAERDSRAQAAAASTGGHGARVP